MKKHRKNRASNNFCSIACHASWESENQRGSNNPNFRNREYNEDGYRIIHTPTYGSIKEHHAVVFEVLKIDKLPEGYHVHHRDCNRLNNVSTNLALIISSDHRWLHKQFGNATLYAHYYSKITTDILCEWSNDPERARRLLDLNILQQSAVVKLGELLENPEEDDQQPSIENDKYVSMKVQRLDGEDCQTNNPSTSAQRLDKDPVKYCNVYINTGCSHIDGILCDYKACTTLTDYLSDDIVRTACITK